MSELLAFPTFGWVRGPYPVPLAEDVPLTRVQSSALRREQARVGVVVDGRLGVQTWCALAGERS